MISMTSQRGQDVVTTKQILEQAKLWGFHCTLTPEGEYQILPPNSRARWTLQRICDRWLLSENGIPQIRFLPQEALAFLERRWRTREQTEFNPPHRPISQHC